MPELNNQNVIWIAAIAAVIFVLYLARPWAHAVLRALLHEAARVLYAGARRLRVERRRVADRLANRRAAHLAGQLETRLAWTVCASPPTSSTPPSGAFAPSTAWPTPPTAGPAR
jgi:hypothetical protein